MATPYTLHVVLPRRPNICIQFVHADEAPEAVENDTCQSSRHNGSLEKSAPKKCGWCRNQSAKTCSNGCCGSCCAKWGPKRCEKHGTQEGEDPDIVSIDSACPEPYELAEKRTKLGAMCLGCKNQAAKMCANACCKRCCRTLGAHTCSQHDTRGQQPAKTTETKPTDDVVSDAVNLLIESAWQAAQANRRVEKPDATPCQ